MLHYYIAYGLMLVVALLTMGKHKSARNYCIAFTIIWTVILGLRHPSMGVDLRYQSDNGYLAVFEVIADLPWGDVFTRRILNYERGYIILNKLISYLSSDPQLLIFICAVIITAIAAVIFNKNSPYPFMSSIIYLALPSFLINFSGLRQALAIAITFMSFEMIKKKKLIWFVLLITLAGTFHGSAYIFLAAYPIYHIRFNRLTSTITVIVPVIVYFFRYPLFEVFSKLFKKNAVIDNNGSVELFIIFWLIYFFCIVFGHERDDFESGTRNLFLMAVVCQAFGGLYDTAMRVGYYFMIYLTLLLPRIIENLQKNKSNLYEMSSSILIYVCIILVFTACGIYGMSVSSWSMANPHTFFWQ